MSANKKTTNDRTSVKLKDVEFEADVLFQKIYGKWYAFSTIEDNCFVAKVSDDEVQKRSKKHPKAT